MVQAMSNRLRFILDFSPLVGFFLGYRFGGLLTGTGILIVATLISLSIIYLKEKRVAMMPLVSGVIVTIMGGLTLYLQDETFIKIKPTLVNLLFSSILLGGMCFGRPMFKYVLGHAMQLEEEGWRRLSLRWGLFFLALAGLNECIWRNFPTDFWVNFKVFGMFTLTMLFTILQLPLIKRYWIEEKGAE
jgi:intracellular septation protein